MPDVIRILYVDDEVEFLEIGKIFLEQQGFWSPESAKTKFIVDTVVSATEAIEKIKQTSYDAIVSDYQMPGMDGIEFLKILRNSGNFIPFIIFTGKGREEVVIQALNEGADFYLQKGGDPSCQFVELSHKIRQAIQQRRAETNIRDLERREAQIINFLPDATFAIDTNGTVIAWNRAMEEMTGVPASRMLGKGDYEYAIPIYHERRAVLIDLVLNDDPVLAARYPSLKREGRTLIADSTSPYLLNGKGADIWFTATPLYDTKGQVIGAIESIRDITERRRAEEALKESEKLYRSVIENIQDVYYRSDRDGNLIMVSPSGLAMLGYDSFDEGLGKPIADTLYFDPAERAAFLADLQKTGSVNNYEIRLKKKDGTLVYASTNSHYYYDESGAFAGVEGILRDITSEKRALSALKDAEETYRNIFFNAQIGLFRTDARTGLILDANDAVAQFLGYPDRASLLAEPFNIAERYVDAGDREYFLSRLRVEGEIRDFEARFRRNDGSVARMRFFARFIPEKGWIEGVSEDITDWKKVEEALRENEERFRFLVENMADIVWTLDMDLRTTYVSPSITKVLGITPEDWMRQSLQEMMPPASYRQVTTLFAEELRRDHEPKTDPDRCIIFETEYYHSDGHIVPMENRVKAMRDADGTVIGVYGTSHDMTERKRVDEKEHREIVRQRMEAEVITRIALSMNLAQGRVDDLVRDVTEAAAQALQTERAGVWFFDAGGMQLVEADTFTASSKTHISGSVLAEQEFQDEFETLKREKFIDASDALTDPRIAGYVDTYLKPNRITSMLDAVIRVGGTNHGVICFEHVDKEHQWQEDEITFACQLADQIALALSNRERERAEEKLKATFTQSVDGIMMTDPDFRITEWNDGMTAIYGYPRDEVLNKPLWEISWAVLAEEHRSQEMLGIMEQRMLEFKHHAGPVGRQSLYEFEIQAKDGQRKTVQMSTFPIRLPDRIIFGSINRDVTEWKQAEYALRESEEKYRKLFSLFRLMVDTMPDMLWAKNINREFIFVNQAICKNLLNAADTEEPLGRTDMFFATREREAHPDQPRWHTFGELCRDSDTITLQEQKPMQFDEFGNIRGEFLYLDVHKAPLYDEAGQLIGVVGSARDVTDQKRAEEESRQHERTITILNEIITAANRAQDLPSLLETGLNKTLALLEYDAGGIYLTDHAAGTAAVVTSRNLPAWILEQVGNVSIRQAPYDSLLVGGIPIVTEHYEEVAPERAKQSGFRSLASIPLVSGNHIIGALNVVSTRRDVVTKGERETLISIGRELGTTIERFTAEKGARQSAANLEILFNSIDEMVFIFDMNGTILRVNETVMKKLGFSREEIIGRVISSLHVPEQREEALRIMQGMTSGTIDSCLVPLLAKDGTRIESETKVMRGLWDGREVLVGLTRDVTERKQTDDALRIAHKKLTLLSEITRHDIITQMMVLQGYLTILEKKQAGAPSEELDKIKKSSDRILSLIQFAKEYERIGVKAPAWQDISTLINMTAGQVQTGDITIKCDIPAGYEVFADPLIERVFFNLIDNAIRWGDATGSIWFDAQVTGNEYRITCKDDGRGIGTEDKEKIFEWGYGRNTGMGLFLAREILAITNISIREVGEPGRGALFEILVPAGKFRKHLI